MNFLQDQKTVQKVFISAISGFLLTLAYPKTGLYPIAFIALIPLFISLRNTTPRQAAFFGGVFGIFHFFTMLVWVIHTLNIYGFLPIWLCVPILFLLSFYLSLYTALFSYILVRFCKRPVAFFFMAPFLWTGLEFIRTHALTGFPWELLGYSQYRFLPIIQIADIAGVYGVTFIIVLVNTALYMIWLYFKNLKIGETGISRKQTLFFSISTLCILFLIIGYGLFRIDQTNKVASYSKTATFSVIQGNIDQSKKWKKPYQISTIDKYNTLSLAAAKENPDLIIWPETAAPFYYIYNGNLTKRVTDNILKTDTPHLIGSPSFKRVNDQFIFYNSAFLTLPYGRTDDKYDKVHLVPFGEYVPLQNLIPFVKKLTEQSGNFYPGEKGKVLRYGDIVPGIQICFEVVFPGLSRAASRNGANVIVNMTNDAWFGKKSAPFQHFSMTVFRAVENRRAIARAANTGISGFIDPNGKILAKTELFTDAHLTRTLPLMNEITLYTRIGDLFAWLSIIITLLIIGIELKTNKLFTSKV